MTTGWLLLPLCVLYTMFVMKSEAVSTGLSVSDPADLVTTLGGTQSLWICLEATHFLLCLCRGASTPGRL